MEKHTWSEKKAYLMVGVQDHLHLVTRKLFEEVYILPFEMTYYSLLLTCMAISIFGDFATYGGWRAQRSAVTRSILRGTQRRWFNLVLMAHQAFHPSEVYKTDGIRMALEQGIAINVCVQTVSIMSTCSESPSGVRCIPIIMPGKGLAGPERHRVVESPFWEIVAKTVTNKFTTAIMEISLTFKKYLPLDGSPGKLSP
ncbi:hypothetical protein KIN20_012398 [Parelaphostrongylus tenuis]|uniref:Uncharacterized protein n=1 Tax=Parelaphostrongylus tenuis TaxID=148309 RepID=A0AAD5QQF3_PARTN|nr:hypothetical protein KIN20_012398 [Parelaphostrongylus tenuis]